MNAAQRLGLATAVVMSMTPAVLAQSTTKANPNPKTTRATTTTTTTPASTRSTSNDQFPIRLERRAQVGQKLHIVGEGTQTRKLTTLVGESNQQVNAQSVTVKFDADAEVNNVDEIGRPTLVTYTVRKCTMNLDGTTSTICPAGERMTAMRGANGKTTFTVNGNPVNSEATEALNIVAGLSHGGSSDDDVFGTSSPRAIGESWSVNTEHAANEFKRFANMPVKPSDISGQSTLIGSTIQNGQNCLVIRSQVVTENAMPGIDEMPPEFTVEQATMTVDAEGLFPVDASQPRFNQKLNMTMIAVLSGPLGPQQTPSEMRLEGSQTSNVQITPISPGIMATGADNSSPEN